MGRSSEERCNASTLPAKTRKRIQEIKNGLVLQVATKKGPFWKEIGETRVRWGIQAPTQLPPDDADLLYPERLLLSKAEDAAAYVYDSHNWEQDISGLSLWLAIPGLQRYREEIDWQPFMAALGPLPATFGRPARVR